MQFAPNKRRFLVDALGEAKVIELEADDSKSLDEWMKEAGVDWGDIYFKGESDDTSWISGEMGLRE